MNQPIDNGIVTHYEEQPYNPLAGGKITHLRRFSDDSAIMYHDNGSVILSWKPRSVLDDNLYSAPMSHLYYWQIIRNRPDVKTQEDIRRAEKEEKEERD
jgi:hypothetical protein